jgi:cobalamin biosynthesis Mg chelatase CobN
MRRILPLVMALALGLVLAPPAMAGLFEDLYTDYAKDGKLDACKYSEKDLRQVQNLIPNDIEQYAPDFPAALDQALEDRARSACPSSGAAAGTTTTTGGQATQPAPPEPAGTTTAAISAPTSTVPSPPGSAQPAAAAADGAIVNAAARTADHGASEVPAPLIALAVVGGLLLLGLLLWGIARFFAWDPAWLAGARHAVAEAGWRAGGLWDDFTDWLRPGRRGPA